MMHIKNGKSFPNYPENSMGFNQARGLADALIKILNFRLPITVSYAKHISMNCTSNNYE